jgi:hypothetical protein
MTIKWFETVLFSFLVKVWLLHVCLALTNTKQAGAYHVILLLHNLSEQSIVSCVLMKIWVE